MTAEDAILHNRRMMEQVLGRPIKYRYDNPAFLGKSREEIDDMIEDAEYLEYYGCPNKLKSVDFL